MQQSSDFPTVSFYILHLKIKPRKKKNLVIKISRTKFFIKDCEKKVSEYILN